MTLEDNITRLHPSFMQIYLGFIRMTSNSSSPYTLDFMGLC